MASTSNDQRRLTELRAPERNRYFYGKLLDAEHLSLEQDYVRGRAMQLDRLVLGAGVVCGLEVTAVRQGGDLGVAISPGVALDGWGRRIVVVEEATLLPATLTEPPDAGAPFESATLRLCHCECETDHGPALAPDPRCGCEAATEAGAVVESFRLEVVAGAAPAVARACTESVLAHLRAGELDAAVAVIASAACPAVPADPCVVLANLRLDGGALEIDPAPRQIVPTNATLLRLLACLAARIEECCAGGATPAPAPPTEPEVTP
jgi:hypothetical protein